MLVAAGSFVVQQGAIRDGDLAVGGVDGEPAAGIVGQGVGHAIAGIGIDTDGDIDDRAIGRVLVDRGPEEDVGGRFVHIADGDREGFGVGVAGAVGDLDGDAVAARGLVVEQGAVGDGDLAGGAVDGEAAAGVVGQGVAGAVAGVGIGDGDRADGGAVGAVLVDRVPGEGQVGGGLVHIADGDGEGLGVGVAGAVGDFDGDAVAARGLVVEQGAVCDGDLAGAAVDGEPAAGIVGESVARAVAGVGIGDRDRAHGGAVGAVLVHRIAGEGQVGGRLVDIADGDREGLGVGVAGTVGDLDGDAVAACGLVVELGAVCDGDLAGGAVDGEAAAGIVGERVAGSCRRHPDR